MQHAGLCPAGSFRHASRATFLPEEGKGQTDVRGGVQGGDTSSTANAVPLASQSPPHSQMLSPAPARLCILLALGDTV